MLIRTGSIKAICSEIAHLVPQRSLPLPEPLSVTLVSSDQVEVPTRTRLLAKPVTSTLPMNPTYHVADGKYPDPAAYSTRIPLVIHPIDDLDDVPLVETQLALFVGDERVDRSDPRSRSSGRHRRWSRFASGEWAGLRGGVPSRTGWGVMVRDGRGNLAVSVGLGSRRSSTPASTATAATTRTGGLSRSRVSSTLILLGQL
jgi:hypothetical protein